MAQQPKTTYKIIGEVLLKPYKEGVFELAEDFIVIRSSLSGVERFTVKAGLKTDMGSVPRILRRWFPYIGNQALSASYVLHDALYATQSHCHDLSKQTVDDILWEMITFLPSGVAKWKVGLIWSAVDWFGWPAWDSYTGDDWEAITQKQLNHRWANA